MNKLLHRTKFALALWGFAAFASGCATGPLGPGSETSLEARRLSVAATPLAQAQLAKSQRSLNPRENVGGMQGAERVPSEVTNAIATTDSRNANRVAPAQYAAPRLGPTPSSPSYSVPREPLGTPAQFIDPSAPASGSPYHRAGYTTPTVRGHEHSGGGNCPHCSGSNYVPVYPQMSANQGGCSGCGASSCSGACQTSCGPDYAFAVPTCADPQEYIFDGGDRDPQVRLRSDLSQTGLDPEDTVIQYTTQDGKTQVESGCRVAIYAPRFGSVRKRTGTSIADLALRPQAASLPNGPGTLREQLPPVNMTAPVKPLNKDNVRVVEAFRERQRPLPADLILPMGVLSDAFKPFEDLDIIRNGDLKATDPAKLALLTAAARVWTNVDELQVIIDGQEAAIISDLKQAREVTLYEHKGARIRLCKVASEQMANPGDVISFTIRFDNVGEQPLSKLVITDSLAPRLEYVPNSQQSSIAAQFKEQPNEAGSSVLRWEIEKELKPGDGGLVRFSTKVR